MANEYPLDSDSITRQIVSGGIQFESPFPANQLQLIYLDFDGELTKYRNADLNMEIDDVQVEDSKLTQERIAGIVASLNAEFALQNIRFVTERPKDAAYSTIFIGKTSAFDQYGQFAGLAETVDLDNRIKNDNAFVLLDSSDSDSGIISTISHEAEHLIGTLDHGDGLDRYADNIYYYYQNNCTVKDHLFYIDVSPYATEFHFDLVHYSSDMEIVSTSWSNITNSKTYYCLGS